MDARQYFCYKFVSVALIPLICSPIYAKCMSSRQKKLSAKSLEISGNLSGEIHESLLNYRLIVAYDKD